MKIKFSIWLLAIGFAIDFIGAWMKIVHRPFADLTLGVSALVKVLGLISLVIFFLNHPKIKEFLEYDQFSDSFKK